MVTRSQAFSTRTGGVFGPETAPLQSLPWLAHSYTHYPHLNRILVRCARFFLILSAGTFVVFPLSPPVVAAHPHLLYVPFVLLLLSGACFVVGRASRITLSRTGLTAYRWNHPHADPVGRHSLHRVHCYTDASASLSAPAPPDTGHRRVVYHWFARPCRSCFLV